MLERHVHTNAMQLQYLHYATTMSVIHALSPLCSLLQTLDDFHSRSCGTTLHVIATPMGPLHRLLQTLWWSYCTEEAVHASRHYLLLVETSCQNPAK